jgi:hypothetical protein
MSPFGSAAAAAAAAAAAFYLKRSCSRLLK